MHRANYRVGDGNWGIWEPKINFDRRPASTGAASHYRCTVKLNAFLEQLIPNFRGTRRPRTEETRASHNGSRKTTLIATWWTTKLDYRFMVAPMVAHCSEFLSTYDTRTVFIGPTKRDLIRFLFSSSLEDRCACIRSLGQKTIGPVSGFAD